MAFPKDAVFKVVTSFHRMVFDLSKGKLAGKTSGMPVLKLTTVGRKSGQRRSTMLTSPLVEGDNLVLVASKGGDDRDPDWFGNLVANPDVDVVMDGANQGRCRHGSPRASNAPGCGKSSPPSTPTTPAISARRRDRSPWWCSSLSPDQRSLGPG